MAKLQVNCLLTSDFETLNAQADYFYDFLCGLGLRNLKRIFTISKRWHVSAIDQFIQEYQVLEMQSFLLCLIDMVEKAGHEVEKSNKLVTMGEDREVDLEMLYPKPCSHLEIEIGDLNREDVWATLDQSALQSKNIISEVS
ncbi:MAG: hypothetical protein MMC33_000596 [Icmadophila ericetorum]|nr:hypothetical protein [Icmadophila ericetorum]